MEDNSDEATRMSFVIRFQIYGNAWVGTVTRVAGDGVSRAREFRDSQSMLNFIHRKLAEKSSIPFPPRRSVS